MTHTDNYNHHDIKKSPADLQPFMQLLEQGGRVLDLGCGAGIDLAWLSQSGFDCMGIDSSAEMVAASKIIHAHSGVVIQQKNFLFLNLAEAEFDGVWANLSFPFLAPEELQRLLAICFRGVKVGGILGAVLFEGAGSFEEILGKTYLYSEKALCSMFEQTGFQVLRVGRRAGDESALSKILILAKRV